MGDWVVYYMPRGMMKKVKPMEDTADLDDSKYSFSWSLPAKVVEVRDKVLIVRDWGTEIERQVPVAHTRKLEGQVPPSLQQLTTKMLEYEVPKGRRPRVVQREFGTLSWPTLLENTGSRKRRIVQAEGSSERTSKAVHEQEEN
jgi:hypothetical protein